MLVLQKFRHSESMCAWTYMNSSNHLKVVRLGELKAGVWWIWVIYWDDLLRDWLIWMSNNLHINISTNNCFIYSCAHALAYVKRFWAPAVILALGLSWEWTTHMVKGKQHEKGDILQKATLSSSLPLNSCCCASSYHLLFCCGLHLFFFLFWLVGEGIF